MRGGTRTRTGLDARLRGGVVELRLIHLVLW
jgi:hypothetical protein